MYSCFCKSTNCIKACHSYMSSDIGMNDIMPTMNLDDYDLEKHKQHLKTIATELARTFSFKKDERRA